MDYKRLLVSAGFIMLISLIINSGGLFFNAEEYASNSNIWNNHILEAEVSFFILTLVSGFILGIILTLVYTIIAKSIRQKSILKTGIFYGILLFILVGIPLILNTYISFAISSYLLMCLIIQNFIILLLSGIGIVYIMRYTCKFSNAGNLK